MSDATEQLIATAYRPLYVFDSRENVRRGNEPFTPYRLATKISRRNPSHCATTPSEIRIYYGFIFAEDGGYATSRFCSDRHLGDNTAIEVRLAVSADGRTFRPTAVLSDNGWWPRTHAWFFSGYNPILYPSAGKHHVYLDTSMNGQGFRNAWFGCREGINGRGAVVFANLVHPRAPRGWTNVGEPDAHPSEYFVGDLTPYGFRREHAWSTEPFCGGHGHCSSGSTSSMASLWQAH